LRERPYVNEIISHYLESNTQLYPNVISNYFRFFVKMGVKDSRLYNKLTKDIQDQLDNFRPAVMLDLMKSLSISRLSQKFLLVSIAKRVVQKIDHYRKELPELVYYFGNFLVNALILARIGFQDDNFRQMIKKMTDLIEQSNFDFGFQTRRGSHLLWSLLVFDMKSPLVRILDLLKYKDSKIVGKF
jgi:hypothetical protein